MVPHAFCSVPQVFGLTRLEPSLLAHLSCVAGRAACDPLTPRTASTRSEDNNGRERAKLVFCCTSTADSRGCCRPFVPAFSHFPSVAHRWCCWGCWCWCEGMRVQTFISDGALSLFICKVRRAGSEGLDSETVDSFIWQRQSKAGTKAEKGQQLSSADTLLRDPS